MLEELSFTLDTRLALATLLLPLLSFMLLSIWPKKHTAGVWVSTFILLVAFILSCYLFSVYWTETAGHARWVWFEVGTTIFTAGIWLNNLTVLLLCLVTFVSFLVHLFSIEYMKGDKGYLRYFAFLGLFTFSMLGIVLADNLLIVFVFWELVGLSSYLLIGFWYQKESAAAASKKAFLVNRIGDIAFLIGLMLLWNSFQTLDLVYIVDHFDVNDPMLFTASLCLFGGVVGKSAQFPLLVWLPDAMEGPTPVSALIHAATMVAAGVFLLARVVAFIPVEGLQIIGLIGAITAFMGGVAAMQQFDLKKILAYSTISQLGYMVVGIGAGAYEAAIFHLITHAFFKACLFLSAGAIIHSLHLLAHKNDVQFDAQDIRLMGGLGKQMPFTFVVFLLSSLALMGVPFFSGFLSKDAILLAAGQNFTGIWGVIPVFAFLSVAITAFYVIRMLLIVFAGKHRLPQVVELKQPKLQEVNLYMKIPLALLASGSLFFVFSLNPLDGSNGWLLSGLSMPVHGHSLYVPLVSVALLLLGANYAYRNFKPSKQYILELHKEPNYKNAWQSLSYNNWHLDKIYELAFVRQVISMGRGWAYVENSIINKAVDSFAVANVVLAKVVGSFDRNVVDGLVHVSVFMSRGVGWLARKVQTGHVQTHIAWAGAGLLLFIIWLIV